MGDRNETSIHVRRARRGDRDSLQWIVSRLSPLLLAQARYRLPPRLRRYCEPEDLVQEVWMVALPRLGDLSARDGRETPVLLKFLSTTLVHHVNNLTRRHLRRRTVARETEIGAQADDDRPGVVTRVARSEAFENTLAAIESLEEAHREVLILRGVERQDNGQVAARLGISPNAASLRWNRAIEELRRRIPDSVFDELA